jgi:hypothetical protein
MDPFTDEVSRITAAIPTAIPRADRRVRSRCAVSVQRSRVSVAHFPESARRVDALRATRAAGWR